jgi:hypothetical protein
VIPLPSIDNCRLIQVHPNVFVPLVITMMAMLIVHNVIQLVKLVKLKPEIVSFVLQITTIEEIVSPTAAAMTAGTMTQQLDSKTVLNAQRSMPITKLATMMEPM